MDHIIIIVIDYLSVTSLALLNLLTYTLLLTFINSFGLSLCHYFVLLLVFNCKTLKVSTSFPIEDFDDKHSCADDSIDENLDFNDEFDDELFDFDNEKWKEYFNSNEILNIKKLILKL